MSQPVEIYGIENGIFREPVRVVMHLPEAWTRVLLIRTYRLGLADGGICWDIPTERIPEHLRGIGSVFALRTQIPNVRIENSEERYKRRFEDLIITELPPEELHQYLNSDSDY